ncbi:hypothetical protein CEXT_97241 [Caerostris extrusa]|uniref:Uncharacterized protein n=1 Tax=Caerostris extrusa TaxID=172846 RepID=A0AAV4XVJ6_CAEEX|nr:hypothetical protein CEXT_97241 [Caerostris extrusa]
MRYTKYWGTTTYVLKIFLRKINATRSLFQAKWKIFAAYNLLSVSSSAKALAVVQSRQSFQTRKHLPSLLRLRGVKYPDNMFIPLFPSSATTRTWWGRSRLYPTAV